jgi:hypothetical protein
MDNLKRTLYFIKTALNGDADISIGVRDGEIVWEFHGLYEIGELNHLERVVSVTIGPDTDVEALVSHIEKHLSGEEITD